MIKCFYFKPNILVGSSSKKYLIDLVGANESIHNCFGKFDLILTMLGFKNSKIIN